MEADIASQAVGLTSTDFSIVQLFLRADIIVKSVIIILIAASVYSWAIIFDKYKIFYQSSWFIKYIHKKMKSFILYHDFII